MDCCILCLKRKTFPDTSNFVLIKDYLSGKFDQTSITSDFIEIFGTEGLRLCIKEILTLHFPSGVRIEFFLKSIYKINLN